MHACVYLLPYRGRVSCTSVACAVDQLARTLSHARTYAAVALRGNRCSRLFTSCVKSSPVECVASNHLRQAVVALNDLPSLPAYAKVALRLPYCAFLSAERGGVLEPRSHANTHGTSSSHCHYEYQPSIQPNPHSPAAIHLHHHLHRPRHPPPCAPSSLFSGIVRIPHARLFLPASDHSAARARPFFATLTVSPLDAPSDRA